MTELKDRIDWVDSVRGFAIILMIIGHLINPSRPLAKLIYMFHIPLFFILSGYLLNNDKSMSNSFKKSFQNLIIPMVFASIIHLVVWFIFETRVPLLNIPIDVIENIFSSYIILMLYAIGDFNIYPGLRFIEPIGALWFLPCLFLCLVLSRLMLKIGNIIARSILSIVLVMLGIVIGKFIYLPWSMDLAIVSQFFVLFGYYFRKYEVFEDQKLALLMIAPAIIISTICFTTGVVSLNSRSFGIPIVSFSAALVVSYYTIYIFRFFNSVAWLKGLNATFTYFGIQTLIILSFYKDIYDYMPERIVTIAKYHWILGTFYILLVCSVISYFVKKSIFFSRLLDPTNIHRLKFKRAAGTSDPNS